MCRMCAFAIGLTLASTLGTRAVAEDKPILERIEWSDVWVVDADRDELPRVLLAGDSIVKGYYDSVSRALEGKASVARYATSKFMGNPDYLAELEILLKGYDFDVIHINNGLHGWGYTEEQYRESFPALLESLKKCAPDAKVIWAMSTPIRKSDDLSQLDEKDVRLVERNRIAGEIMAEHEFPVNDLYTLVVDHPEYFAQDGVHFSEQGRIAQGQQVAAMVEEALGKE
ncbi:MAG: SGNH/GDSL hydrolase family protein [Candidatus Hydrogenedentes bacterium]|nr:SGNH/GDSL hydrolase family protein [Candidatus Hydrogenedentota bacterium]